MRQVVCTVLLALSATAALGQEVRAPNQGGTTNSLGLPRRFQTYAGLSVGGHFGDEHQLAAFGKVGVYKDIMNPVVGVLGWALEGYGGFRGTEGDGGLRASLVSPSLRLGFGVDYNFVDETTDFMMTVFVPVRRGGVFGHGTDLRLEWIPNRGHSVNLAVTVPLGKSHLGRTRARDDHVRLTHPKPAPVHHRPSPALEDALANVRHLGHLINWLTTPYLDHNALKRSGALAKYRASMEELQGQLRSEHPLLPDGVTSEGIVRLYHAEIDRAFSIAHAGEALPFGESTPIGREIAGAAKLVILDEVLLPYNATLGLARRPDTVAELIVNARGAFVRRLVQWISPDTAAGGRWRAVGSAMLELLDMIEKERDWAHEQWERSRLVWLPLQWTLAPEEHDEQEEINRLVEGVTGLQLTPGNDVWYVRNEEFQKEFYRMVQAAEDYHVLWIHDYRGRNDKGKPDRIAFEQTRGYLLALIGRVNAYDETGRLPVFIMLLDQFYWEVNEGRLWSELLQDPLRHQLDLPQSHAWMETEITELQEELWQAVADSRLLQAEARQYGQDWLHNQVKVHINITNPADPTFWSGQVIPIVGMPDNVMRDHRKISFYDITEEDPYRGEVIYTGMGIGEHYTGPTWEDRAILARGPAALGVKYAARALLKNQGFQEPQIPYPLQVREKPKDYDDRVEAHVDPIAGLRSQAVEIHNQTGYRPKPINAAKAVLYTMMPRGSVALVPDSLWNNPLWASMLLGSSLRGNRALLIAPSLEGAPSSGAPQMSRGQELWERLVIAQQMLGPEIAEAGGLLKTGLYDPDVGVGDVPGRVRSLIQTVERNPWLKSLIDFHPQVYAALDEVSQQLEDEGFAPKYLSEKAELETPKLHLKAHFFASGQAWDQLLRRPEWTELLTIMLKHSADQMRDQDASDLKKVPTQMEEVAERLVGNYLEELSPEERERIVYYLAVGSHNMDYRSMMMDGEVMFLTTYFDALNGLVDFIAMTGLCDWVETQEQLDALLPPYSGWQRTFGRWIKIGL